MINPRPLSEKETSFRESLSEDYTGFVDFVVGEHYFKDGKFEEALNAYKDGYSKLQKFARINRDSWLESYVTARLYELKDLNKSEDERDVIENGEQDK